MSTSPPKTDNNPDFLNSVYKKLTQDPDQTKLIKLMSNVSTHAIAEQFPGFPGHWILTNDGFGQAQYFRLDNGLGGQSSTLIKPEGIRGKLKGNYQRSPSKSPPKNTQQQEEKEEEKDRSMMDIEELTAYITQVDDDEGNKKKNKKKNKNKKKKSKKSISPNKSIEEEKEEEEEVEVEHVEEGQGAEIVEVILGSSLGDTTEGEENIQSPSEDTSPFVQEEHNLADEANNPTITESEQTRVLSPLPQNQNQKEEVGTVENTSDTVQHSNEIIPTSLPQSPITVKLPPNSNIINTSPRSTPPPQLEHDIIYFGDIPTRITRSTDNEIQQIPREEVLSHTRNSSTADEEIVTPVLNSIDTLPHTAVSFIPKQSQTSSQNSSHSSATMSNPTPPQSPPMEEGLIDPSAGPSTITRKFDPIQIHIQRPLTPPSEVDDEEADGSLVFPDEPPKPSLPATEQVDISPIPSITLNTPTSPNEPLYPLNSSWTLYFSNTSHQRKSTPTPSLPSTPLIPSPLGRFPDAADYSSHLITLFKANNLEDLFGSWKALRRKISQSKNRQIEPLGDTSLKGGMGIGTHYFPDETNFHFFKSGIQPMWEDRLCQKGGKIMIAGEALAMDNLFLDAILLLISGEIEAELPPPPGSTSTVCGVVLSRRKFTRIEIWLGGEQAPEKTWVEEITRFIEDKFKGWRVYGYKSFTKN